MIPQKQSSAKQVSIIAMVAAIYAVFFYRIRTRYVARIYPYFTFQSFLLGVFPIWFGWSGLAGCMIGAFIGGVYVEQVAPYCGMGRISYCIIIFGLNWLLIPKKAVEGKSKRNSYSPNSSLRYYSYSLEQLTYFGNTPICFNIGIMTFSILGAFSLPDCSCSNLWLNFVFNCVCPALIKNSYAETEELGACTLATLLNGEVAEQNPT